jgi:hypothetical protein
MARSKYESIEEMVFVNKITPRPSKYGSEIFEIEFVGIDSQRHYTTYCDPQNRNFRNWQTVIEREKREALVLENLKLKDAAKGIVNADSKFEIKLDVRDRAAFADMIAQHWDSQKTSFESLFG